MYSQIFKKLTINRRNKVTKFKTAFPFFYAKVCSDRSFHFGIKIFSFQFQIYCDIIPYYNISFIKIAYTKNLILYLSG